MNQYGYQQENIISGKDWVLGGVHGLGGLEVLKEDGQYDEYLPVLEIQRSAFFDSYACVSYATLNAIEIILKLRYGIDENFSDRYLAAKSGTRCGFGNFISVVNDTLLESGSCKEVYYPWDKKLVKTCADYMQQVTNELDELAKINFLDKYKYNWMWGWRIGETNKTEGRKDALRYSPLTVSVYAWGQPDSNGLYSYQDNQPHNHLVVLYGYEDGKYWKVYDHYDRSRKKLAWDYNFGAVTAHFINKKEDMTEISDKKEWAKGELVKAGLSKGTYLIQQTGDDGSGQFGCLIDGVLRLGDLAEVLATVFNRKGLPGGGVVKEVWDNLDHLDLKGNKLN